MSITVKADSLASVNDGLSESVALLIVTLLELIWPKVCRVAPLAFRVEPEPSVRLLPAVVPVFETFTEPPEVTRPPVSVPLVVSEPA